MTRIGKEFKQALLEKTGEKRRCVCSKHLRNIIALRENFNCNVYYLTSNIPRGFWNFSERQLSELKGSKSNRGFLIVFLTASDYGYLIYEDEVDKYLKDLPVVEGYYKIKEDYLRTINIHPFNTIDGFIDLLSPYRKETS